METVARGSAARGHVIRKVLFLIGNRHFLIRKCHFGIAQGSYVERGQCFNKPFLLSGASNDSPPPTHRRHRYRFRRSRRLLGHDCSEERCLPGNERLVDLQVTAAKAAAGTYAEVNATLRSSEIE